MALVNVMSSGRRRQVRNTKNAKVNQTDVIGQMAGMSVADVGYQGHVTTTKLGIIADVERDAKPGLTRKGKTVVYLNCGYSNRRPYGK